MSASALPGNGLKDLLWNIQLGPNPELKYSLADYWADKGKQEEFISGTLPDGANWTTNLVLSHYKNHFPWEWVQGKFGIGPDKGFDALLASQSIITVPTAFILLLGLITMLGLGYLLCYKTGGAIKIADLKKHKQHYKRIVGGITILGAIVLLCSALLFLQSATPVINSGLFTFGRITSFILHDLEVYRKLLILEIDYFFDTYIAANFKHLFNLPYVVEEMKSILRLNQHRTIHDAAFFSMSASALRLTHLRGSVFTAMNSTILIRRNVTDEIASLNAQLTQLARFCQGEGLSGCLPTNDSVAFSLPMVDVVKNSLSNIDNAFLDINFTGAKDMFSVMDGSFSALIGRGDISASIETLADVIETEAVKGKRQYALAEGLPVTEDFTKGPANFWQWVNGVQDKYGAVIYALCLALTLLLAGYATATGLTMLMCVLGTRGSKFPCYRRTSTATTSASIMLTINDVILGTIVPVTVMAALALIGGTLATVLAEAINSRAIFDKLIDISPYINHTLVVGGLTIQIDSFKRPLSICEKTNPGILFALDVTLPEVVMAPLDMSLLNGRNTKNYIGRALNSLADQADTRVTSAAINAFQGAPLPSLLLSAGVLTRGGESLLHNASLRHVQASENFKNLRASASDPRKQANLQSLLSGYAQIGSRLSWLNGQLKELHQNIAPINTDLSTMSSHYTVLKDGFTDIRTNAINAVGTLRNTSMVEQLYEVLVNRLRLVSDNYLERSLDVFKISLGRCGHLSFIYTVVSEVCFFTATRYANVLWLTLVILSVSMASTSFSSVHMYRYFGAFQNIDYTTDEQLLKLSAKESELPLSKRRRTVRGTLADIFSGLAGSKRRKKKAKRNKKAVVARTATILSLNEEDNVSVVFKSEDDLHLCTWDEIAKASLSFQFSNLDGPLIHPDPNDPPYQLSPLQLPPFQPSPLELSPLQSSSLQSSPHQPHTSSHSKLNEKLKSASKHSKAGKVVNEAKNTNIAKQKLKRKSGKSKEPTADAKSHRRKGGESVYTTLTEVREHPDEATYSTITRSAGVVSPQDVYVSPTNVTETDYTQFISLSNREDYQPLTLAVLEEPEPKSEDDSSGRYMSLKGSRESFVQELLPTEAEEQFGNFVQLKESAPALAAGYGMESFNTIKTAVSRPSDIGSPVPRNNLDVLYEENPESQRAEEGI